MSNQQDMNERMQAAQLGLNVGAQGANLYNSMGTQMQSAQQFYDQMGEQARQFNAQGQMSANNQQLQMQSQMFNQAQQRHEKGLVVNSTGSKWDPGHVGYDYGF